MSATSFDYRAFEGFYGALIKTLAAYTTLTDSPFRLTADRFSVGYQFEQSKLETGYEVFIGPDAAVEGNPEGNSFELQRNYVFTVCGYNETTSVETEKLAFALMSVMLGLGKTAIDTFGIFDNFQFVGNTVGPVWQDEKKQAWMFQFTLSVTICPNEVQLT